jgi:membrane protease YdiL (CAAX protease family)
MNLFSLSPIQLLGAVAAFLPLAAGIVLDVAFLRRCLRERRIRFLPDAQSLEPLRQRPWTPGDSAVLLAVLFCLAMPGILTALRPGTAAGQGFMTLRAILPSLLIYAVLFAGILLAASRLRGGVGPALGLARARLPSSIRAGCIRGLACLPPVFVTAWIGQEILSALGFRVALQDVFDWLGDPNFSTGGKALLVAFAVLLAPCAEEAVFRGVLLPTLLRRVRPWAALAILNAAFALMHLHAPSFLPLFVLGISFSLGMMATGSVVTPIVMHMIFNSQSILLFLAVPDLVS